MKKFFAMILALVMCLCLCACGAADTEPTTEATTEVTTEAPTEPPLTEVQQMVVDAVKDLIATEEFASWEELYTQFTGKEVKNEPMVADVTRYKIKDFESVEMDCYLVNVPVSIGRWINEEAEQGSIENAIYLFIDAETKTVYDSITTDAMNGTNDTSTDLGRATYLMWIYAASQTGDYEGNFLNDTEVVTNMSEDEMERINDVLTSKG